MSTTLNSAADGTQALTTPPAPTKSPPEIAPPPSATIPTTPAAADSVDDADEEYDDSPQLNRFLLFNAVPSSIVSGVIHFVAFLALALWSIDPKPVVETLEINAAAPQQSEDVAQLAQEQLNLQLDAPIADQHSDAIQQVIQDLAITTDAPAVAVDVETAPIQVELSDFGERTAPKSDLMATIGAASGAGLTGRGESERGQMVQQIGGTSASEAAVAAALKWFVNHQNKDGSWSFDHRTGQCQGRCSDPGTLDDCRTGATAMALLPFLGAGQTHQQGQYKENVERGLYFLTNAMKVRNAGGMQTGDLAQGKGSMYSHGLAAIALTEAYAMTHDRKLMGPAQLSINHIVNAQDPVGGGWRYVPRQPGDTSVVGWQLMALKSGHMAYLVVPPSTIQGSVRFLDSVQADSGALYGYTTPGQGQGTTAVGLLCRMYLGWKQDNPALKRGVERLSKWGPSKGNMYYNYYATQVMRQYCGDPGTEGHEMWERWNTQMRDSLVKAQEKNGHEAGSWMMAGDHGSERGGRVYCTSMATMILEVYYRHMPIYGKQAATEDFPL
jgi:hypothetical protein